MSDGAAAASRRTTSAVFAAFGTRNTSSSLTKYAMRSSTTPPVSVQQSVYCACPGAIRSRSFARHAFTNARAPRPRTVALPRCETSKMPTDSRTAACSFSTPPPLPGYSIGISQPPKSASFAPSATCLSYSGERSKSATKQNLLLCSYDHRVPSVSIVSPDSPLRADAVVVGVVDGTGGPTLAPGAEPVDAMLDGRLCEALRVAGAKGRPDEVTKIPTLGLADVPLVVGSGLGERPGDAEAARRAVGAALRTLTDKRRVHVAINAPAGALAEGALLGAYQFTEYKSRAGKPVLRTVTLSGAPASRAEVRRAAIVAEAVALTRDLVNTPPNDLYPLSFADRAAALATARGLPVEVLDERALRRAKYGGILGVGQGSTRPPRLVRISYRPARPKAHVALVGKGITFDSGGLNLKTANLTWMKSDMGGAAAVIASTLALAALKVPVAVTATVPMAENMPSGSSYRPSDVLTMHNGRTVEVADTDAEGRLVLADAITRASE